jgi:hypothetical protein
VAVLLHQRLEVVLDGVEALLVAQLGEDAGGALAVAVAADGAVADVAAGGTRPVGILESIL